MGIEVTEQAIKDVFDHLVEAARTRRISTESYSKMFEASEFGLRGLLDELDGAMNKAVLDAVTVIEERTGKSVSNELFFALQCMPFIRDLIKNHIVANEGFSCSVDKAREVVKDYGLSQLWEKSRQPNTPIERETSKENT